MAFNIGDDEFNLISKRFPDDIYFNNINVFEYIEFNKNGAIIHYFNGSTEELDIGESKKLRREFRIKFSKKETSFKIKNTTFFHIIKEDGNKTYISNFAIKNIMGFSKQNIKVVMKSGESLEFLSFYRNISFENLIRDYEKFSDGPVIRYLDEYSW